MSASRAAERPDNDEGRAIIEVIWLAVLVLIPVVYLLVSVLGVQSATFAVAQAAREAARVLDLAPSADVGYRNARDVAARTLTDQNVATVGLRLKYVPRGADCRTATPITPDLTPGATFDVCVSAPLNLPLLPVELSAANSVTGVYTYHVGEFREAR